MNLDIQDKLPISSDTISTVTQNDETLKIIRDFILNGWPDKVDASLKHYAYKKKLLATEDGSIFYGERILIPFSVRKSVLEWLHDTHIGVVQMKALARTYVWWPGIDIDIENWCKCCRPCQSMGSKKNESELSSWPKTSVPFQRIHIDFYELVGRTFLILADTYSNWLEVFLMNKTDASSTIEKLRLVFSVFGLPGEIVSDDGPPFGSGEIRRFCESNGIKLTHSPSYHPQSNGEAEVSVRTAK